MFRLHMLRKGEQFTKDFHTHEEMGLYMVSLVGTDTIVMRVECV